MSSGSIERTLLGPDGRSLQIRRTPEGLFYFEEIQIVTPDEEEVRITGRAEPYQNTWVALASTAALQKPRQMRAGRSTG